MLGSGFGGSGEVFAGRLDSNESKRLTVTDSNAIHSHHGELLFVREGALLRQSFDATTLEIGGDPTPVAEQVAVGNNRGAFSVSENGVLAYQIEPITSGNLQLTWVDRTGKSVEAFGPPGQYRGVDVSPNGQRIAVHRHDVTGGGISLLESSGERR